MSGRQKFLSVTYIENGQAKPMLLTEEQVNRTRLNPDAKKDFEKFNVPAVHEKPAIIVPDDYVEYAKDAPKAGTMSFGKGNEPLATPDSQTYKHDEADKEKYVYPHNYTVDRSNKVINRNVSTIGELFVYPGAKTKLDDPKNWEIARTKGWRINSEGKRELVAQTLDGKEIVLDSFEAERAIVSQVDAVAEAKIIAKLDTKEKLEKHSKLTLGERAQKRKELLEFEGGERPKAEEFKTPIPDSFDKSEVQAFRENYRTGNFGGPRDVNHYIAYNGYTAKVVSWVQNEADKKWYLQVLQKDPTTNATQIVTLDQNALETARRSKGAYNDPILNREKRTSGNSATVPAKPPSYSPGENAVLPPGAQMVTPKGI